jgi:uncharacterized phage-associated protein
MKTFQNGRAKAMSANGKTPSGFESFDLKPTAVANYFVSKGIEEGSPVGLLKVVKLVYFAYGAVLAYFDKKLFSERIEAWNYGPVVPSVYHSFKSYGKKLITEPVMELVADDETFKFRETMPKISNDTLKSLNAKLSDGTTMNMLDVVWKIYGKYSGVRLIDITHKEGSPWTEVYRNGEMSIQIPDETIQSYFRSEGFTP